MMYYHTDDSGTWAIADTTLNILVLVATGDPSGRRGFSDLRPECAVLWEDTPYEVTVEGTSNVLIWVGREERHDLDLAPGAAAATQGALVQLEIASGQQDGLLDVALQSYRGRDEERLRRLVADYRESLRESGD